MRIIDQALLGSTDVRKLDAFAPTQQHVYSRRDMQQRNGEESAIFGPVSLFEAAPRLGGHARTVMAGMRGDQPVDTGFIVFNYANYPHLTAMFRDLDVPVAKSDMSFGASIDGGRIEYGLKTLATLTAQKSNLFRPGFARMVRDILRFNAQAEALAEDDGATIGELMDAMKLGRWFQDYYLTPLSGAIWTLCSHRTAATSRLSPRLVYKRPSRERDAASPGLIFTTALYA